MTTHQFHIQPAPVADFESILAELNEPPDEWCLDSPHDPDKSLCGADVEGFWMPESEIPEENLCKACRRIRDAGSAKE